MTRVIRRDGGKEKYVRLTTNKQILLLSEFLDTSFAIFSGLLVPSSSITFLLGGILILSILSPITT